MSKLPSYANKGEMTTLVMMGTVTQLMSNAAKFYQDKEKSEWSRKLKCAATYIRNVMNSRYETLDSEQQKTHDRRYKKMNMYVSCTDTERYDPETQDDVKINVVTDDLYKLAEGMIEGQCKQCERTGQEVIDCEYKAVMLRLCIPISENLSECPFGDKQQNFKRAVDAEFIILKSKLA